MVENIALVFDLDGTLIDSARGIFKSYIYSTSIVEIEKSKISNFENFRKFIGPPFDQMQKKLHPDLDYALSLKLIYNFRRSYDNEGFKIYHMFESVKQCLTNFYNLGFNLYILSNKKHSSVKSIIEKEFPNLFLNYWGRSKNHDKSYILSKLKKKYQNNMIFIGDTLSDLKSAELADVKFIFCQYGYGEIKNYKNLIFCENSKDLEKTIKSMVKNYIKNKVN